MSARASMGLALVVALACVVTPARAAETTVLPRGVFMVDVAYLNTSLDKQWSGDRKPLPLIDDIPRYEPGGGLQGILRAHPFVRFQFLMLQVMYGVTDWLSAGVYVPIVLSTSISTHLTWEAGDYQNSLGRAYTMEDFWQWAESMGQPRVPDSWVGNRFTLSDLTLGARALAPQTEWMRAHHLRAAGLVSAALPTGTQFDPEAAVSAGTNLWELHAAGDFELHASADKAFFVDGDGLSRVSVGADLFGSQFRPHTYRAGHGTVNPLLNNTAPYVGDTYVVTPGGWLGGTLSVDLVPVIGPARASVVSGHSAEKAARLPPLLTLTLAYTGIATAQSDWHSNSPLWDWDREKFWQPGEKHLFKATLTVSLLRLGVPLQLYAGYRTQDLVPGRYTRPSNVFTAGARTLLSFW